MPIVILFTFNYFLFRVYLTRGSSKCVTKIKFKFCRFIQKKVSKSDVAGLDCKYWQEQGWFNKKRPWKHYKKENV